METKETPKKEENKSAPAPKKSSNKALWWILGGCLVLALVIALAIGAAAYFSWKKVKKEIKEKQQKLEQVQNRLMQENADANAKKDSGALPGPASIPEEPQSSASAESGGVPSDIYPPEVSEKAIGYLKKVYTKSGKNYIEVDYVQWLSGDAAEKAMREDGQCPKTGECIVYDGYYIRNQNPLIRTFEVSADAEILAHDFNSYDPNANWNENWTFSRFSNYFNSSENNWRWDAVPFHVEIGNNQVLKITEQYIP